MKKFLKIIISIFKNIKTRHLVLSLTFLLISCEEQASDGDSNESDSTNDLIFNDTDFTPDDWTLETHARLDSPNFLEVFDDSQVKRIDINVDKNRWNLMLNNMIELHGQPGSSTGGRPGGGPPGLDNNENPMWVPADIIYNGLKWYRVGVRFKGNSSLVNTWSRGLMKLSFKLDFDEFEDQYPQIDNQRFYGFKQLSLKNNYEDKSFVREKVVGDIFLESGIVSAHTSFCEVYVDFGEGSSYFGLYTIVEEMDDTVIEDQFDESEGNLYKPEGTSASFRNGSFNKDDFIKDSNENDSDWSDIENLFSVLHSNSRLLESDNWQKELDEIFDTDNFLKWLAYNTVLQNWDTYGRMTHNYFLYNDPQRKKIVWIPWDNNEALQRGKMGGALNLDFSNLSKNGQWPLIEYLISNPNYKIKYDTYVAESIEKEFYSGNLISKYELYYSLLYNSAIKEKNGFTFLNSTGDFQNAITELKSHAEDRNIMAKNYLSN